MTQEPTETVAPPQPDEQDETVGEVLARLYADGRAYAEAEAERQKLRVGIISTGARDALMFAAAGAMLIFASLVACLVGVIFVLVPHLGAGWATVLVFGSGVLIALVLLLIAKSRVGRMKKAIKS